VIVLDASAAVELLAGSPVGRRVGSLLLADDVVSPELLDVETTSALARLVRAGAVTDEAASSRVRALHQMPVTRIRHRPLVDRAWRLRNQVRISDAFYVACAELVDGSLLTTDARLGREALSGVTITVVT
jgi:predicted nucleic acid-binding protein